jgi:hypothetical protein
MAEFDQDNAANQNTEDNAWFNIPANSRVIIAKHTVYVEPETKFYIFCMTLAKAFSLASLIAWFVLLILLIILVFSMVNNLEALQVMRGQEVLFRNYYSH